MQRILAIILFILTTTTSFAGGLDNIYVCRKMAAPKIDGVIDPTEWAVTSEAGGFTITAYEAPATVQTSFRLGYDGKNLYFAIRCEEPKKEAMAAKEKNRDGNVYSEESIDLSVDPLHNHSSGFKFIINSLGTVWDWQSGLDVWDGNVKTAAGGGEGYWTLEMAVPFTELNRKTPKNAEVWGMNVFRHRYVSGTTELINWANAYGIFLWPTHLAHIVFQDSEKPVNPRLHAPEQVKLSQELARHPVFEGRPWSPKEAEFDLEMSLYSKLETPHIDMAGPFPEGPIRTLAFVRMHDWGSGGWITQDCRLRDFAELAQRFDVKPVAVLLTENGVFGAAAGQRRMRALLMEPYDVYMFVDCSPKDLPTDAAEKVNRQITSGAGVLCVGKAIEWLAGQGATNPAAADLARRFPIESLGQYQPLLKAGSSGVTEGAYPILATYDIRKSRAAALLPRGDLNCLTPMMEYSQSNLVDYEYWIGLAGTATTWLAGRDAGIESQFSETSKTVERQRIGYGTPSLGLTRGLVHIRRKNAIGIRNVGPGNTEYFIRDAVGKRSRMWRSGSSLPQGDYFVEARNIKNKSVIGFSAMKLTITGRDYIEGVAVDKEFFEQGESVTGSFTLAELTDLKSPSVRVELVTSDGRVLAERYCKAVPGKQEFSFVTCDDTTPSMQVRVSLYDLGVVQSKSAEFGVPDRKRGEFNFIMWDTHNHPLGVYSAQNMSRAWWNVYLQWPPSPTAVQAGWSATPYTTRITNQQDAAGNGLPVCWNDEEAAAKEIAVRAEKQKEVRKYGVFCYSLGDENDTYHSCLNPACLEDYRKWLKERYVSISALNACWKSDCKSFDEVQMLKGDDSKADGEAFKTGNYPRCGDRQLFARYSYVKAVSQFADAYRAMDPKAITGFEGAGGFGDDPDLIFSVAGMWNTYASIFDDALRTLTPPGVIRGNWMGYAKDADTTNYVAWRAICMGANSLWWWRDDGLGIYRGLLNPTLDLFPAAQALAKEMIPIRDGLGKLLLNARPEDEGVAVFYNIESTLAAQIPSEGPFGQPVTSNIGVVNALKDSGVQFKYVTPKRIAAGALKGVKILFLARAVSMDSKTVAAIRSFVRNGGMVIADIRPAVYDDHMHKLKRGALDDVFGIRQSSVGKLVNIRGSIKVKITGASGRITDGVTGLQSRNHFTLPVQSFADAGCIPVGARASAKASGAPIMLTHRFGGGQAILLNFNMTCYAALRNTPDAVNFQRLVFRLCGPRVRMESPSGKPILMTECNFWKSGAGQLMSLRKDSYGSDWAIPMGGDTRPETVVVTLPSPKHVYDVRNSKYLGRASKIKASLRFGYANFYGLFDKPLGQVKMTCATKPNQGGTALRASIAWPGATTAAVVYLTDPSGKCQEWSRRVVRLDKSGATASWQLPVGSRGRWVVEAKELFTGKVVRTAIGSISAPPAVK